MVPGPAWRDTSLAVLLLLCCPRWRGRSMQVRTGGPWWRSHSHRVPVALGKGQGVVLEFPGGPLAHPHSESIICNCMLSGEEPWGSEGDTWCVLDPNCARAKLMTRPYQDSSSAQRCGRSSRDTRRMEQRLQDSDSLAAASCIRRVGPPSSCPPDSSVGSLLGSGECGHRSGRQESRGQ